MTSYLSHVTYFYKYFFNKMLNIDWYTTWPSFMDIAYLIPFNFRAPLIFAQLKRAKNEGALKWPILKGAN